MAFSTLHSRKTAWLTKTRQKPKPTLGISRQVAASFTKQTLRLSYTAISSVVNAHYGGLNPAQIIDATSKIQPAIKQPNISTLSESLQLIQGTFSVTIKKQHTVSAVKIDQENDFLICVEIFAKAIDTQPDPAEVIQINERVSWNDLHCGLLNLDITTNDQAKMFIALSKQFGLQAEKEIYKLPVASDNLYKELNKILNKEPLDTPLYKASITYLIPMSENDVAGCVGGLLFLLSFSLSRSSNFRYQSWGRRFTEIQRQLLTGNLLLNSLSEGSARELSALLDMKIRDGLDPEALSHEIRFLVNQSFSHIPQLIAVSGQVEYKGLAPIQLIGCAMAERTEVPWDSLF
jgi:hypothetical protein